MWTVNAVIHQVRPWPGRAVHELSTLVDVLWTTIDQPPIANISTLGRFVVEADRSSE